jgi:hypothetical protein
MRRRQLVEIEDLSWFPSALRGYLTDYLGRLSEVVHLYDNVVPLVRDAMQRTGATRIVDLCSGAGAAPRMLKEALGPVEVILTDLYPNLPAFQASGLGFIADPVDATQVPSGLTGFRTMFNAFHHLRPAQARAVLADAARAGEGILIVEVVDRRLPTVATVATGPLTALALTPTIRPLSAGRLFWTYAVPLVPALVLFDGLMSCLRAYSDEELREMTREIPYAWTLGEVPVPLTPVRLRTLLGVPSDRRRP